MTRAWEAARAEQHDWEAVCVSSKEAGVQGCGSTMRFCVLVVSSVSCSHLGVFYENLRNTGSQGSRVSACWSRAGV